MLSLLRLYGPFINVFYFSFSWDIILTHSLFSDDLEVIIVKWTARKILIDCLICRASHVVPAAADDGCRGRRYPSNGRRHFRSRAGGGGGGGGRCVQSPCATAASDHHAHRRHAASHAARQSCRRRRRCRRDGHRRWRHRWRHDACREQRVVRHVAGRIFGHAHLRRRWAGAPLPATCPHQLFTCSASVSLHCPTSLP